MTRRIERLNEVTRINAKIYNLQTQIDNLRKDIRKIVEEDNEYKEYLNRCREANVYLRELSYEDFCLFSELYSKSSSDDENHQFLKEALML